MCSQKSVHIILLILKFLYNLGLIIIQWQIYLFSILVKQINNEFRACFNSSVVRVNIKSLHFVSQLGCVKNNPLWEDSAFFFSNLFLSVYGHYRDGANKNSFKNPSITKHYPIMHASSKFLFSVLSATKVEMKKK